MMRVQLKMEELLQRGDRVRQLLQPLARQSTGPAWQPKVIRGDYIIGTHDGSPPQSDYREWRFSTVAPKIRAMYFERWRSTDRKLWHLDRAYLNLFKLNEIMHSEEELLCLHCDPNEPEGAPHASYKIGPHLHVKGGAPKPFPSAHIALNIGYIESVLHSMESLTEALEWAILMLKEEILEAI